MQATMTEVANGVALGAMRASLIGTDLPGPSRYAFETDAVAGQYALELAAVAGTCAIAATP
jgi:hypothetical protein